MADPSVLGCYLLPGSTSDPAAAIDQARTAEAAGLGCAWIAERYDAKDLAALAGALSQATTRIAINAGTTHSNTRHLMVLASMGQTLQALTGGRFSLAFGRSAAWRWRSYGLTPPTLASMGDTADLLRRLWSGERVTYHGPAGDYPDLRLRALVEAPPPPLLLAAIGPRTLELAGARFDGAILHPFLTPEAVDRSARIVRAAAAAAGRDPAAVTVTATVITAPTRPDVDEASVVVGRLIGYLRSQQLGDAIARANQWDPDALGRLRSHPMLADSANLSASARPEADELAAAGSLLPAAWIDAATAIGTASRCADRLAEYLDAGADRLILHGPTVHGLDGVIAAYRER